MYRAVRFATAEALFSGVTTVHDFNHNVRSLNYAKAAIRALYTQASRARFSMATIKLSHQKKLRTLTVLQLYANRLQTLNRIYCHWICPTRGFCL